MRISKRIVFCILYSVSVAVCTPLYAQIGMESLADSLTAFTGFSSLWSPPVKVKNLRVSGKNVTVKTNKTLMDVRWTPQNVAQLKRNVSRWVLGHEKGKVTILTCNTSIDDLVTDCARQTAEGGLTAKRSNSASDLTDRQIALYPSHGLYFNRDRGEWIWQRATLWTTVEDLYSQEYVRLIRRMLENAGATIHMPRAGLEHQEPGVSGMPQWTEGARYWLMKQGADSTIWDLYEGDEYKDDMKCRAMWINSLKTPIDLCLAFHTDGMDSGNDSTIVGTLVIYTAKDEDRNTRLRDGRNREKINRNLADWIQTQVTSDLQTLAPEWTRRQLKEANYCESRVPVVPSIILELLSHKNMADMRYGLDPNFRFAASRAVYKGILRYLNGKNAVVQPLPVEEIGIQISNLQSSICNLQWKPSLDSLEPSAAPTYYMIYSQADNGEWDVQQVENVTQYQMNLQRGVHYTFYVVAGNEGGLSMPSPQVSAYLADEPLALIVNAFNDSYGPEWFADSTYAGIVPGSFACENYVSYAYIGQQWNYTRSSEWTDDDNCGWGACYRDHAGRRTVGNTHDYSVLHGKVLQQMGISYVSCTAGILTGEAGPTAQRSYSETVLQAKPVLIDLICGRQRQPLTPDLCSLIADYLNTGGRLLLSTDHFSAIDPNWAREHLHTAFHAAHATRSGRIRSAGHRPYRIQLTPNDTQLFSPNPEGLKPTSDEAIRMATYEDMRCPAAIGYKYQTLVFGFPLEAVQDFEPVYRHAIEWLLTPDTANLAE